MVLLVALGIAARNRQWRNRQRVGNSRNLKLGSALVTAQQFRSLLYRLGLTHEEAAKALGYSRSQVWRLANGKTKINVRTAAAIEKLRERIETSH